MESQEAEDEKSGGRIRTEIRKQFGKDEMQESPRILAKTSK